jgi:hypothetical protein
VTDELAERRARSTMRRSVSLEEIDVVASLTETEAKKLLRDVLGDVSRLTAAIDRTHPGAMGPGDATVDVAIALLEDAARAPGSS